MISDILALLGLIKELKQLTRRPVDGLNFNIVRVPKPNEFALQDHMRIVNLLPITICAVRFSLQIGEDRGSSIPIKDIYHSSTDSHPFGKPVLYKIPVNQNGVFIYPGGMYYVPLDEYPSFDWNNDVRVRFHYSTPEDGEKEGNLQRAARAEVLKSE